MESNKAARLSNVNAGDFKIHNAKQAIKVECGVERLANTLIITSQSK